MKRIMLLFILALSVPVFADLAGEYLCRAVVPDGKMVVVLPLGEIADGDDASAYVAWSERTFPEFAGRIDCVWNVDDSFVVKPDGGGLASILQKGDRAVGADGKTRFKVEEVLAADADVELSFDADGFKGDYSPLLSATNLWMGRWVDISSRWEKAVADGKVNGVLAEMRRIRYSGRCRSSIPGGDIWNKRIEAFIKEHSLRQVIRVENRAKRPVLFRFYAAEFEEIVPGGVKFYDIPPEMSDGEKINAEWAVLPADEKTEDGGILCADDFEARTHFKTWPVDSDDFVIEVPENFSDGSFLPKGDPSIEIHGNLLPRDIGVEELRVHVKYSDGDGDVILPDTEKALTGRGFLKLTVRPHRRIESVSVECPGFISRSFTAPDAFRLCKGESKCMTTGTEAKMEREPWPKLKTKIKPDASPFEGPYLLSVVISNVNTSAELASISWSGQTEYSLDLQDGGDFALGKSDETSVFVTVRAWAENADENNEGAAAVVALILSRGSPDALIDLSLHAYIPVPCDWKELEWTGKYVKKHFKDKDGEIIAKICLGDSEEDIKIHFEIINGIVNHLQRNVDSGHVRCLPSCVCQDNAGGISYAEVYAGYAGSSALDRRLAVIAAAVKKAGYDASVDEILKRLKAICE